MDPRHAVWIALADLFLDTDVRIWYVHAARVLAESPFSLDELQRILDDEVTPALQGNLLDVAGEWAGFDNDWVVSTVAAHGRGMRLVHMDHHWRPLARLITILRATPAEERSARIACWNALFPLFLEPKPRLQPPPGIPQVEVERCFKEELEPALMESVRRIEGRQPTLYPTEAQVFDNWRRFRELL